MSKVSLNIKKRLDVTTADERIKAGVVSDSENIIIRDMQKYIEEQRKKFENDSSLNMSSKNNIEHHQDEKTNNKTSILERIKLWFVKYVMRKHIEKVKTC